MLFIKDIKSKKLMAASIFSNAKMTMVFALHISFIFAIILGKQLILNMRFT